eukprot:2592496-Lingulodinium_polyedra.AAC.1
MAPRSHWPSLARAHIWARCAKRRGVLSPSKRSWRGSPSAAKKTARVVGRAFGHPSSISPNRNNSARYLRGPSQSAGRPAPRGRRRPRAS